MEDREYSYHFDPHDDSHVVRASPRLIKRIAFWCAASVLAVLLVLCMVAEALAQGYSSKMRMVDSTVQVFTGPSGSGTGTVVHSKVRNGFLETYIVTNHHVAAYGFTKKYSPDRKKEIVFWGAARVKWFLQDGTTVERLADLVGYDTTQDLALFKVRHKWYPLADGEVKAVAEFDLAPLRVFDEVFSIGATFGKPPFPTNGIISVAKVVREDKSEVFQHTANLMVGASGGGTYRLNRLTGSYQMVGVNVAVYPYWSTEIKSPMPVPPLAVEVPITYVSFSIPVRFVNDLMKKYIKQPDEKIRQARARS